jgi:acetate kinase
MKALRASDSPAAALAIDLFAYRIVREIGSLAAALGGIDGLVFTGGIGENDARLRRQVCEGCAWLGVRIDPELNAEAAMRIDAEGAGIATLIVPTNEEWMIAQHVHSLLEPSNRVLAEPVAPSLA